MLETSDAGRWVVCPINPASQRLKIVRFYEKEFFGFIALQSSGEPGFGKISYLRALVFTQNLMHHCFAV